MKTILSILLVIAVIVLIIILPIVWEVGTTAIPKICALLSLSYLEGKVIFLFQVSFWASIVKAIGQFITAITQISSID